MNTRKEQRAIDEMEIAMEHGTLTVPRSLAATACSPFVVLNLRRLKLISCADRDIMQDAISALRANGVKYIAMRWHAGAETYVQMEAHE